MFPLNRSVAVVVLLVWGMLGVGSAAPLLSTRTAYERQLVDWALKKAGLEIDPSPGGKRIERIEIVRENIIANSDPWPNWFNIFHATTRDYIIRQEVLVKVGETYDHARTLETARNIRLLDIIAVAQAVAAKGKNGGVVILIVTKDLWSIRLNMALNVTGNLLSEFDARPTERNLFGRGKEFGLHVGVTQVESGKLRDRLTLGARYLDRRVLGSRIEWDQRIDFHLDGDVPCAGSVGDALETDPRAWCPTRKLGDLSGASVTTIVRQPLYSLASKWGFALSGILDIRQRRFYRQNNPNPADTNRAPGERPGLSLRALAFEHSDGTQRNVPFVYDGERLIGRASLVRSFGEKIRHDFRVGLLSYRVRFDEPEGFPFDAETREWFRGAVLPRSESATAITLRYSTRPKRYVRLRNIRSFLLTEDFALGPTINIEFRFAQGLAGTRPFTEVLSENLYRGYWRDNLLTAGVAFTARHQPGLVGSSPWVNNLLTLSVENAFPKVLFGRFHIYSRLLLRKNDLGRAFSDLGGSNGLRGYPNGALFGRNQFRVSAEYRSSPLRLWILYIGAVLFYDGGSAWGSPGPGQDDPPFRYRQSAGIGLRTIFPQFDRQVLRVDFGVPFSQGESGGLGTWFTVSFAQNFPTSPLLFNVRQ